MRRHTPLYHINKIIRAAKTALLCSAVLLCGGCATDFSADNLLSPPKLSDEQTEIYNALTAAAGRVDLRYPRTGEYRSAFVIHNLDKEPGNEAIVFYESKSAALDVASEKQVGNLRIGFLDRDKDGKWRTVYEMPAAGTEVESVEFSDLGGGKERMLVSYSVLNSSDMVMAVIDYSNGVAASLAQLSFADYRLCEFTEEGKEELLIFSRDKAERTAALSVYGCDSNGELAKHYNTVTLGTNISEYDNITTGSCQLLDDITACVAVDYMVSDGVYGTDVVYFNGKGFVTSDVFVYKGNKINYIRQTNAFTPNIHSTDIDGDGIIDIPVSTPMPGYEKLSASEQVMAFSWYSQKSSGSELVAYTFTDPGGNYTLTFPGRWLGMVTAEIDQVEGSVIFRQAEEDTEDGLGFPLLNIRVIQKGTDTTSKKTELAQQDAYYLFSEDSEKMIYVKSVMYEGLSLTEDEIATALTINSED